LTHNFLGILPYLKTVNQIFQNVLLLLKEYQVLLLLLPQESQSMMQVEEPSDAQDFVIICNNAPFDINNSQLLHEEFRTDPEFSSK
jgi:hypothetical protein